MTVVNEIHGGYYSGKETQPQVIAVSKPITGEYQLELFGLDSGDFSLILVFVGPDGNETYRSRVQSNIQKGTVKKYVVEIFDTGEITVIEEVPLPFPWWILGAVAVVMLVIGGMLVLWRRRKTKSLETGQTEVLTEKSNAS